VAERRAPLGVTNVFGESRNPLATGDEDQAMIDRSGGNGYVGRFSRVEPDAFEDCFGFEGLLLKREKLTAKVGRRHSASFVS
jgi:hypothetical protein